MKTIIGLALVLALLVALPVSAKNKHMAIQYEQKGTWTLVNDTTATVAFGSDVKDKGFIFFVEGGASTVVSVADNQGNTYNKITTDESVTMYYAENLSAGALTITITYVASPPFEASGTYEYSGIATNNSFTNYGEVTPYSSEGTPVFPGAPVSTFNFEVDTTEANPYADSLAIGVAPSVLGATPTFGDGWSAGDEFDGFAGGWSSYKVLNTTEIQTFDYSYLALNDTAPIEENLFIVVFKGSSNQRGCKYKKPSSGGIKFKKPATGGWKLKTK
jgi:hypothetical protein